ncbi:hypothetical protein [Brevundimonas vesicularis]|uniref:hypothetical protein n=1 Tax=Brevundimonas vesicularis TaxID=41276 RepID=UPI0025DC65C5|nr:hypothetical protein [Brevundimonas vesicularis]
MDDQIDGSPDGRVTKDLVLGIPPVVGDVRQLLVVDHDQEVEVREIAILWFVHPVRSCVGPEQDDLEDLAAASPTRVGAAAACPGRLESGKQDVANALKFTLLTLRQMFQIGPHWLSLSKTLTL